MGTRDHWRTEPNLLEYLLFLVMKFETPQYWKIKNEQFRTIKERDLKRSFCSQDIWILVLTFCWYRKKWIALKEKANGGMYDVTARLTNNHNTHIAQYLNKLRQSDNKFDQLIEYIKRSNFLQCRKWGKEASSRPL